MFFVRTCDVIPVSEDEADAKEPVILCCCSLGEISSMVAQTCMQLRAWNIILCALITSELWHVRSHPLAVGGSSATLFASLPPPHSCGNVRILTQQFAPTSRRSILNASSGSQGVAWVPCITDGRNNDGLHVFSSEVYN